MTRKSAAEDSGSYNRDDNKAKTLASFAASRYSEQVQNHYARDGTSRSHKHDSAA
jgi:hypothetical protein